MLSHDSIWRAIDALAERHRLSPSGLARRAGLDPTSFNRSKRKSRDGRDRWPSTESISKILDATGATVEQFTALLQPGSGAARPAGIPLLGFAQAGSGGYFDDGGFPAGQGWDEIDFPVSDGDRAGVYALEVQGDSMLPLYRDGDILIIDPSAHVRRGDRVVVRTQGGEVMAKILARQTPRGIELMSLNPEHPDRSFEMKDVEWIARILWASQ
ncbi:S24 family peptidase [Sinorhizobium alkalisoli]|uniref:DNA-binding protein n=1 Tax=Sinorhizobium alkalisoli TaxID=1752398 RepID=A0A1E3V9H8_9HYPH|nr:helix-turn-helix transcriptional regulator [Sinorhizobium alkalisoli]MCA1491150.1 helix-turn-helix transcriptional regulator [Ensifer sp. NBAIM29]MCG5477529.1 helix-turn-helix transcriptional regulator [Sinorhizobium alkalisoli]ODR90294.1 DNA-binding protein [Sinorhizobium alkalisoli]